MFNKKRAAFLRRTALNIKSNYKGMKNYITNEILPDTLNDLAIKFLENSDKLSITIKLDKDNNLPALTIRIAEYGSSTSELHTLVEQRYTMLPKVSDGYDVIEDTIHAALMRF